MTESEAKLRLYQSMERNNICTVVAASLCVSCLALATGSLHSLWGLLILLNISYYKGEKKEPAGED